MPRHSAPDAHRLSVAVPRGQDGFWQVIRQLDKAGPWSVIDVDAESNTHKASVRDFVRRLVKAGIARVAGTAPGNGTPMTLYRLLKNPADTPRLRRDGSMARPSGQQQMWRAMRSLRQFDAAELAFAASTDDAAIDLVAARSYINRLSAAGYLAMVSPGKTTGGMAVWRLKPSMHTGPKAPQVMRTHFIFDPNRGEIVGASTAEREARA